MPFQFQAVVCITLHYTTHTRTHTHTQTRTHYLTAISQWLAYTCAVTCRYCCIAINVSEPIVPFRETIIEPPKHDMVNEAIEGENVMVKNLDKDQG